MENLVLLLLSNPVVLALPILGYIISKWLNQEPKGLVKHDLMSNQVSQNPSWHLPIVVIGYLLSFLINIVVYSIFSISFLLLKTTQLIQWIYNNIILHVWNAIKYLCTMIWDTIIMIIRIFIEYLIKTPISILIKVINSVPYTLKWDNYFNSYKTIAIGSIISGVLIFSGYLSGIDIIGTAGSPFIFAIALTWIVGRVSFGSKQHGKKAALFALSVIGIITLLAVFVFSSNQLDAIYNWGGPFTGFLYSPSVFLIVVAIILLLTVVFITNVGAIYINKNGEGNSFKQNLKGVINQSFNRSWLFIIQPLSTISVSFIIIAIPAALLYFSSTTLNSSIVNPAINNKTSTLLKEIDNLKISKNLIEDDQISQADFDKSIENLKVKNRIEINIQENTRLSSYFNSALTSGISYKVKPIMTFDEINSNIDRLKENKSKKEKQKTEIIKSIDNSIESMMSYSGGDNESINKLKISKTRIEKYYNTEIAGIDEYIAQEETNKSWYSVTYFLILIGSGLLFSFLLSLFANIYAASVLPVYNMWESSFIVNQFKEAKAKNEYQPWVGLMLLNTLFIVMFAMGSVKLIIKNKFNNQNSNIENIQNGDESNSMETPIYNNEYSDAAEATAATESSYDYTDEQQTDQDYSSEQVEPMHEDSYYDEPQD